MCFSSKYIDNIPSSSHYKHAPFDRKENYFARHVFSYQRPCVYSTNAFLISLNQQVPQWIVGYELYVCFFFFFTKIKEAEAY